MQESINFIKSNTPPTEFFTFFKCITVSNCAKRHIFSTLILYLIFLSPETGLQIYFWPTFNWTIDVQQRNQP